MKYLSSFSAEEMSRKEVQRLVQRLICVYVEKK